MKAWAIVVFVWIIIWTFEDINQDRNIFDRYNIKKYGTVAFLRIVYLISGIVWII
jgi:hypothetical protein